MNLKNKNFAKTTVLVLKYCCVFSMCSCAYVPVVGEFPGEQPGVQPEQQIDQEARKARRNDVYTVGRFECIAGDEGEGLLYSGSLQSSELMDTVKLDVQYKFRFREYLDGVDSEEWFCIPRRRICYAEISESSWIGDYAPGQSGEFLKQDVFESYEHTLPALIEKLYTRRCS